MSATVYLLTPPFTQLNTPYPATAYLKGFLNTRGISSYQSDLGIEVTIALYSKKGFERLFLSVSENFTGLSENGKRMLALKETYIQTVDAVVGFLQGKDPTLAYRICKRDFLPEAARFEQLDDLIWAFGTMGIEDKARHLATLYLEDIADLIKESVDEHFGLSRYAEKLGRSANSFDELYTQLQRENSFTDLLLLEILENRIAACKPRLVAISVPFPGNLYCAFRCAQWIKQHHPDVKIAMGGGFPNTELRALSDTRVFEFFDFVTLDDGEAPLEKLVEHICEDLPASELKRTFTLLDKKPAYLNNASCKDYKLKETGTPDYTDLLLDSYLSAIEIINPMHSLWSNGRWNKLTMAHGCYWGKCTFCDITLDYIRLYEPVSASLICDRMEALIQQTGQTGFHFVDEAAPPALMRAVALEIIRRNLVVSWWTNIRFEKSFTRDLCLLLKASGCIGVSGGLEVASDRLLSLIQKGITVSQVARVNQHFTEAGIMVHAYLMYGFPTQTAQETIDSLEMVRQLFEAGVLQSAFWHRFTMTAHSPVGQDPEKFRVTKKSLEPGSFANNDIEHEDPSGADHDSYSYGLKKSLFNYMQGACFDYPLHRWFDFKTPKTSISPDHIRKALEHPPASHDATGLTVVFLGKLPEINIVSKSKKGNTWSQAELRFETTKGTLVIKTGESEGLWLLEWLPKLSIGITSTTTLKKLKEDYDAKGLPDFELFWHNKPVNSLFKAGLLQI